MQNDNNLLKTKRIPKYVLSGDPVFTFSLPGEEFCTLFLVSYAIVYVCTL